MPPYRPIYMWKSLLWNIKNILLFSQHLKLTNFIVNRFQHHLSVLSARKLRSVLLNHFDDLHFWFNFLNFILKCVRMHINQLILLSKEMWIESLSELIFESGISCVGDTIDHLIPWLIINLWRFNIVIFVGNVDSFFVSTLDLDHIVLMIKAMIQSYKNGVYHGNEAGTRKAQNTIRVALGFDEIEEWKN